MAMRYQETKLWERTLGQPATNTLEESALERLRKAFETAHERVKPIVRQAHIDCCGLTIHDESHLDALWQIAQIISGDDYPLNPVEAFVFGAGVLFHDSALSVTAYEGGLDAIKSTTEWQRAIHKMTGRSSVDDLELTADQAQTIERAALFATLRVLHGQQAIDP